MTTEIERVLAARAAKPLDAITCNFTGKMRDGYPCTVAVDDYKDNVCSSVLICSECGNNQVMEQGLLLERGAESKWIEYLGVDLSSLVRMSA